MRQFIPGESIEKYLEEVSRESATTMSTTATFIPPRLTQAQRDALPDPCIGILIYNTNTNKLNFCNDPSNATPADRWAVVTN